MIERHSNSRINWKPINLLTLSLIVTLFSIQTPATVSAAEMCKDGKRDLTKSYDVIHARGGFWGLMEKTAGLQDKSVLGLQTDGKVRRTVSIFEEMCEEGKTPTPALYNDISDLIGDGRMIFNMNPDRTPPKKIMKKIQEVNDKAATLLKKLGE
jgi:hypothetical protein